MVSVKVTNDNFYTEVIKSDKTVLLDFWASWCQPCAMMASVIDEVGKENEDTLKVCKVNVDEEPELASRFMIKSIPTVIVFKNGKPTGMNVGVCSKKHLLQMLSNE